MLAWRETVREVHEYGTRLFAQLTHHGVEAFTADTLLPQWAPSPVPNPAVRETPKEMTAVEIRELQDAFRRAASYALEAGFDGIELKVAHDGILRTFLSPFYNRRGDEYGAADPDNRLRFVLETLGAVRGEIGNVPLGIRFCLDERMPGGYSLDEGIALAVAIAQSGLIDYLSADMGTWTSLDVLIPPMTVPEGYADKAVGAVRRETGLPVVAFGRIVSPGHAASLLESGVADLIGMARQLLTDPEWPRKVLEGRPEDIRPCVHCNQECVGRLIRELPISCVHNPAAGREKRLGETTRRPARQRRRVVVAGGGPAGLKAAEVAALRGHNVVLLERERQLGGQVLLAAATPHHEEWGEIASHLAQRIERLGVEVRLEVEATTQAILAEEPDAVVVATGSRPGPVPFPTDGSVDVLDEWQALVNLTTGVRRIAVLDLGVRHEGASVVESLAERGHGVRWLAPTPTVGFEIDPATLAVLLPRLARLGVQRIAETTVVEATGGGILIRNVFEQTTQRLDDVDMLVVVGAKVANAGLARALQDEGVEVQSIGDCIAPRHVAIAIYEGELAGRAL